MLPLRHFLRMALNALLRNRMQTLLAMLGVMVGVGALVTSLALGRGAQDALNDQLRAAGANMIVVTAGNYQVKREQGVDGDSMHMAFAAPEVPGGARLMPAVLWAPASPVFGEPPLVEPPLVERMPARSAGWLIPAHFENDPMAEHDHPTARERLGDSMAGLGAVATLTRDDARAIGAEIAGVQHVVSGVHENVRVIVGGRADRKPYFTRMHGTEAALPEIRGGWTMPHGRFLNAADVEKSAQVMVLGRVIADRLFGADADPVGRTLLLWNQPFKVVGVIGSRSWAAQPAAGDDQFDAVYVPVSTVHRLLNLSKLNTVMITTASVGDTTRVAKEITELLRRRHGIAGHVADDFTVTTMAQQVLGKGLPPALAKAVVGNMASVDRMTIEQLSASLKRSNRTMLALLAGVAAVSLLVGGIGVMNLLLLSVTQRTREVGLRIALGARRSDIAWQFVLEALLLSLLGGVLGIVCGIIVAGGLEEMFQWSAVVSPLTAGLAILVAALLGIGFGVYPARRAARLDPIEALRHE